MRRFVSAVLTIAGTIGLSYGQTGLGAKYDTRDPFTCKSKKEPAKGAPSASQVKDYVRCNSISGEKTGGGYLSLFENAQFEIGKSRPFSSWYDAGSTAIDNSEPVYPIRGTFDLYSCRPPGSMGSPAGANCTRKKATEFTGTCFKTTFGDWSCQGHTMGDGFAGVETNIAPPK